MEIIITEPLNKFSSKIYQGERWRYPTMTDVKFINDTYLVAAHRYGCKIYVIHLQSNTFTIVHTLIMNYKGKPYQTESFVIVNNTIYMISFSNVMTIIDILPDYTLEQRCSIQLCNSFIPYHGISFHKNLVITTPSKRTIGTEYIMSYDITTREIKKIVSLGDNIRVKAITFVPNDLVVVVVNYKTETSMIEKGHMFNGSIRLYTSDYVLVSNVEIPLTHFDAVISRDNIFYATGADLNGGYIFKGVVCNGQLVDITKHQTEDFPHGIDIQNNKIAYTSYKTSGIHFIDDLGLGFT